MDGPLHISAQQIGRFSSCEWCVGFAMFSAMNAVHCSFLSRPDLGLSKLCQAREATAKSVRAVFQHHTIYLSLLSRALWSLLDGGGVSYSVGVGSVQALCSSMWCSCHGIQS